MRGMYRSATIIMALAALAVLAIKQPAEAQRGRNVLRSNEIRTRHLAAGSVTSGKLAVKIVTVTVAMGAATGSSAADPTLAGGLVIGCVPAGNQDQFVDNVVLNADGSITITLAANGTAANTFKVSAIKADAKGVT